MIGADIWYWLNGFSYPFGMCESIDGGDSGHENLRANNVSTHPHLLHIVRHATQTQNANTRHATYPGIIISFQ